MTVNKTAAIVLAAGYSSRMGEMKALMPLGQQTVIERVVASLKAAGCDPIVVVTGHKSEEINGHLKDKGVYLEYNPDYEKGMFSSVLQGVKAIVPHRPSRFFVFPVDHPLVSPQLLQRLIQSQTTTDASVVFPVYGGLKGHPPLISFGCVPAILLHDGTNGLQGVLSHFEREAVFVECEEPGVLADMDTPQAYKRNLQMVQGAHIPKQFFLQGDIHIGKSALLEGLLQKHLGNLGGFYVQRCRNHLGRTVAFALRSVEKDRLKRKAVCPNEQMFLKKEREVWRFNPSVFENWAADLLEENLNNPPKLVLLGEIGGMELACPRFVSLLYRLFDSQIPCIGVYKQQKNAQAQKNSVAIGTDYDKNRKNLVKKLVAGGGTIVTLTENNKEDIQKKAEEFLNSCF